MKSRNGLVQTWHWGTVRRGGAPSCARASSSSRSFVSQRFFRSAPERRSSTRLRFLRSASEMPASSLPTFFSSATECSRMCLSVVGRAILRPLTLGVDLAALGVTAVVHALRRATLAVHGEGRVGRACLDVNLAAFAVVQVALEEDRVGSTDVPALSLALEPAVALLALQFGEVEVQLVVFIVQDGRAVCVELRHRLDHACLFPVGQQLPRFVLVLALAAQFAIRVRAQELVAPFF